MSTTLKEYQVTIRFLAENQRLADHAVRLMLRCFNIDGVKAKAGKVIESPVQPPIVVYTDGGCDPKRDGVGAWAYLITFPDGTVKEDCAALAGTTNNRMELMAVIKALESLTPGPPVKIVSDSQYVIKGVTQWSRNWVRNGWKTYDGKPVINRDLWEALLALCQQHDVSFEHVKGHAGNPRNERVDRLCSKAMSNAYRESLAGVEIDEGCERAFP